MKKTFLACALMAFLAGCQAVYNVEPVPVPDRLDEGRVVFVRAKKNNLFFGNHSLVEYVEVMYDRFSYNEAGQPVVEVGIRYRGPVGFANWFKNAPSQLNIATTCNFYESADAQAGGPIVYATPRQPITINLGETYAYKAVCPIKDVKGFQLVLGE